MITTESGMWFHMEDSVNNLETIFQVLDVTKDDVYYHQWVKVPGGWELDSDDYDPDEEECSMWEELRIWHHWVNNGYGNQGSVTVALPNQVTGWLKAMKIMEI
jgi:hypothetical protein